jgi:antitoxin (DNA-binding transcriptional repressor) of toxin-antitoxin stability system
MQTIDITTTTFRQSQKKYLDMVRKGIKVLIHSGTDIFQIVPVESKTWEPSEDTLKAMDQAREDYENGNYVSCSSKEELDALLEKL